jgi:hydroxymethylglutaryl-CoA synthase
MELFGDNTNVEGIDTLNACYGGTNALLNSINWVESCAWDGRYAMVVAADIAVYERGPARPSGGCAAVVMLIGKDAPIVMESGLRGSHMEHAYDFYKPTHSSEYPVVDGQLSIDCYLRALDICYGHYKTKFQQKFNSNKTFSVDDADFIVCHSPFNKLVQKSIGRFVYNDFLADTSNPKYASAVQFKDLPRQSTYQHKDITATFANLSAELYKKKVVPSILLPTELGNMYCASLYGGLMSLIDSKRDDLLGKRILLFSYGSGACSTLFSLKVVRPISHIARISDISARLHQRRMVTPEEFTQMLLQNEKRYTQASGYTPVQSLDSIFPGAYYLEKIDELYRRTYKRSAKVLHSKL